MERFAFKIDKTLKANLYKICRLCGIDNPDKVNILGNPESAVNVDEGEPELRRKIEVCIGFIISKDDKMPQTMCTLCVDKINDFYEFREMCFATNAQTRKLLGLKQETKKTANIKPEIRDDVKDVLPPHHLKRIIFGKNKRKRNHEEITLKTDTKEDVEVKVEKSSTSGVPLRKKLRFSASNVNSSPITVASIAVAAISAAQKKNKPLTPMQRRALEQSKKDAMKKELRSREDTSKKELKTKEDVTKKETKSKEDLMKKELKLKDDLSKKDLKSKEDLSKKELKSKEDSSKKELKPKEEIKDEPVEAASFGNQKLEAISAPNSTSLKLGKFKQCCTICDQRFVSKVQLERHLYSSHVPNIPRFICTACNETIKKSNDIKNHQLWHKLSKTPFICGLCGEHLQSVYAYSKHLRDHTNETPTTLLVLDRECPQCQQTFVTNFLYNTHPCSVNTKRCAGCNRLQRNETEYLRHAALCSKVYINYSKHISAAAVAEESCVRIKNENDVEAAAAAEALARSAGTSLDMTPVVSLTRLTVPMLMNANQCVLIPRVIENEETISTSKIAKKNNKKGVSKKDLKRVDELLKSTMDTLVSIKHEPEIHMDTDVTLAAEIEDNNDGADVEAHEVSTAEDDFHAGNETEEPTSDAITIKQECLDLVEKEENIKAAENIKKEAEDLPVNKIPVLKLKITMEHGKLNSSLVEENARSEKKKKKKKRKDADKAREKFVENEKTITQDDNGESETITIKDKTEGGNITKLDSSSDSMVMPQPGIITIKQERIDDDLTCPMHVPNYNEEDQMMSLVMTSIPHEMDFQISCVSSGVDFATNISDDINPEIDSMVASEIEDVKPCIEDLELLLQISNVSGGVKVSHSELHQKVVLEHDNIKKSTKPKKIKAVVLPPSSRKALKSTSGAKRNQDKTCSVPRIVSVSSADDIALCGDLNKIVVKKERLDVGYGDKVPLNQETENGENSSGVVYPIDDRHECARDQEDIVGTKNLPDFNEEEEYIASIDFSNIAIKSEKDIEVSEVEFNESIMNMSIVQNGLDSMTNVTKLVSKTQKFQDHCTNVEGNDYVNEEQIEEDDFEGEIEEEVGEEEEDDEEYYEQDEIEEEREYRELELPPMLRELEPEECSSKSNIDSNIDQDLEIFQGNEADTNQCISKHSKIDLAQNPMTLVITNVVSEAKGSGAIHSDSKNCEGISYVEKSLDILTNAKQDATDFVERTQFKIQTDVSERLEIPNTREEYQNISSDVSSTSTLCIANNSSATDTTGEYKNIPSDTSLPIATDILNKDSAAPSEGFTLESTRINFEGSESLEVPKNTVKEHEIMISDMSSSSINIGSSNTIVGLIIESTKGDLKILNKNISLNISTPETKSILEGCTADVNDCMIPEYATADLSTSKSPDDTAGIRIDHENILIDINKAADTSSTEIIVGMITGSTERSLKATPFHEQSPSGNIDQTLESNITLATESDLEELQNHLNLEASEQNSITLPSLDSEVVHNFINTTSLLLNQMHPYLEDISSSSSDNFNNSLLPESPTASSAAAASYVSAPLLNEEAENIVNETTDANNLLLDQNNINEIAENNNNANLERELNDDSLSSNMGRVNESQDRT